MFPRKNSSCLLKKDTFQMQQVLMDDDPRVAQLLDGKHVGEVLYSR